MCHIHTLKITEKDHLLYHSNPEAAGNCTDRRTKLKVWKPTNLHLSTGMTFFITFITNHFYTEFWRKRSALPSICVFFLTKENKLLILMKHLITFWIRTKRKAPVILQISISRPTWFRQWICSYLCLSTTPENSRPHTAG